MSRNTTYLILTAAATVTVVASVSAQAKPLLVPAGRSHPSVAPQLTGLSLGTTTVVAPGISISTPFAVESFKTSFGSGLGVSVGYGFNPIWSVFGSLDFAKQGSGISDAEGSFALVHAEAGVRANLPFSNPRVVPFASGSVGRRAVGARVTADGFDGSFDMSFSGMTR
ncbi:MAG: outer membrane beta-barrel protein [Gemmatimonadaceae bacterium]